MNKILIESEFQKLLEISGVTYLSPVNFHSLKAILINSDEAFMTSDPKLIAQAMFIVICKKIAESYKNEIILNFEFDEMLNEFEKILK